MESDLLLFITLLVPPIWCQTQVGIEMVSYRDNLTSAWTHQTTVGHFLKSSRWTRQATKMKESEQLEVIRLHNLYRGMVVPSAADMEYMEWDDRLAAIAQQWAENCQWKHGNPRHNFPGSLGQNLYKGSISYVSKAMSLWYEEYKDYDYYTKICQPNKKCGHYTQIAWSTSRLVGCGITDRCWDDYRYYIVCNYWPPGNYRGIHPYLEGKPCTHCNFTGNGLCASNSCVSRAQCEKNKIDCVCDLKCYNCGELDRKNCKCKCKDGWKSADCTEPCVDTKKECKKYDCWTEKQSRNHPCKNTCGICKGVNQSDLRNTCCDGVLCPFGQVYYPSDRPCVCRILCPGPKCGALLHGPFRLLHFVLLVITILSSEYYAL